MGSLAGTRSRCARTRRRETARRGRSGRRAPTATAARDSGWRARDENAASTAVCVSPRSLTCDLSLASSKWTSRTVGIEDIARWRGCARGRVEAPPRCFARERRRMTPGNRAWR